MIEAMTYASILALHLGLTVTTALIGVAGLYALLRGGERFSRRVAAFLAVVAALEVATGATLAAISPAVDALSLGSHIALYLGACASLEAALVVRIKRLGVYAESLGKSRAS
jgi:hypothetical protein